MKARGTITDFEERSREWALESEEHENRLRAAQEETRSLRERQSHLAAEVRTAVCMKDVIVGSVGDADSTAAHMEKYAGSVASSLAAGC